ncbi:MAG: pyridoxamine 5'-phosphate oxidase [Neisseriaceae bacterium]|nr:pyridoxamine 5'-phosphate oxidase [Neisseriaceae bacterium]MBP6861522.1 pyridoxamine 5'-phosphate oxidase [Neisseriaceae bacterium]
MDLHNIRQDYAKKELSIKECLPSPVSQFEVWLKEAMNAEVNEPTAMNLATVDASGRPTARMVLLKEVANGGFVFFTNYESRKGQALSAHPFAALTFFWPELERSVRIEGRVTKASDAVSDDYFASRPYASRVGAWASEQSKTIIGKSVLVTRAAQFGLKHPLSVPRPPHWGGYVLTPDRVEFWQGRPSRLHDRVVYLLNQDEQAWDKERLAP